MRALTSKVLDLALDDAVAWSARGVELPVAVNVFGPSVADLGLPRQIIAALDRKGLSPDMLTVEITEDLLLENLLKTRAVLSSLREHGVRIAIDDFGSGYSALWYLREFPVDEVKLDRHFIAPILNHLPSAAIARAVIDLARALDITSVAEGVENAATAEALLQYGCEVAQGFYFSPPIPAGAIADLACAQRSPAEPVSEDHAPSGVKLSEIELMQ
jgi:EAL domain-containing protein (putative c-di-GMP-specific phosphodiesterase class I)